MKLSTYFCEQIHRKRITIKCGHCAIGNLTTRDSHGDVSVCPLGAILGGFFLLLSRIIGVDIKVSLTRATRVSTTSYKYNGRVLYILNLNCCFYEYTEF